MPTLVNRLRTQIMDGFTVQGYGSYRGSTYESNVPFVLRYMIDKSIQGSDWIELPAGSYSIRDSSQKTSRCSTEVDVYFDQSLYGAKNAVK